MTANRALRDSWVVLVLVFALVFVLVFVLWALLGAGQAWAQAGGPDDDPTSDGSQADRPALADGELGEAGEARPWADGISTERQQKANALLEEGNQLLFELLFTEALAKYEQAVKQWNHPAIRFNMAVSLYNLGRLVKAHDNLEQALRYGAAPLEASVYEQAVRYQKLLDSQLAELIVICDEDGVDVALDGKHLFTGPGKARRRLLPGEHQIVGSKDGFLPETRLMKLVPGKPETLSLSLVSVDEAIVVTRRRWQRWKPWAAVGAGVAVGLFGLSLRLQAGSNFEARDREVSLRCPGPEGCPDPELLADLEGQKSRATWQNRFGVSFMIAGGAAAVAGMTLVILNQPRAVRLRGTERATVSFAPVLSPTVLGISGQVSF